jgi:membrane protein YdbS with pleckstrin-like domain
MQRYEFQSPRQRLVERIRKWVAVISLTLTAAIFWGAVAAGLVKYALGLSSEHAFALLVIFASVIFLVYFYFCRHKLARAAGFDDSL